MRGEGEGVEKERKGKKKREKESKEGIIQLHRTPGSSFTPQHIIINVKFFIHAHICLYLRSDFKDNTLEKHALAGTVIAH